ncbi:MerR family transcriptional regulator [Pseudoscardovia suis]
MSSGRPDAHVDAMTGAAVTNRVGRSLSSSFTDADGSDDEPAYSISQVAQIMGVAPSALRYYDHEGLLPHVERINGVRVFRNKDFPWLRVLQCLKNTGMPIRRIKEYAQLCEEGDASLEQRYELIKAQRQAVLDQIEQLKFYLQELDFKDWYYRTAIAAGTESAVHVDEAPDMEPDRIPDTQEATGSEAAVGRKDDDCDSGNGDDIRPHVPNPADI